jgi:hypothetical protein
VVVESSKEVYSNPQAMTHIIGLPRHPSKHLKLFIM